MSKLSLMLLLSAVLLGCQHPDSKPTSPKQKQQPPAAPGAGELSAILSTRLQPGGVETRGADGTYAPLAVGSQIPKGGAVRTVAGVQARITLVGGTVLHLNERSELIVGGERRVSLKSGELLADVTPAATAAEIETAQGQIRITGTKLNVKVEADATLVDVTRGTVEVAGRTGGSHVEVGAGEHAVIKSGSAPKVSLSQDLAEITRWSRELAPLPGQPQSLQPGIGSLEARVPLQGKSFALRLARQEVRVIVHDNVARTEVEQEYYNGSSQTLEGTYRFPLPAGASISRLALYVGNRLEEGEIVERQRARQIFRQIVDDAVRPRDPALLEWVGGRTFQMKIFPIPPRGSRRVILGYTQLLPASYGRYRYEYPLASDPGKATTVGRFLVDLRASSGRGLPVVQTPLYPMISEKEQDAVRLRYEASEFRPAASFVASILPASQPPELQLALYEPEPGKQARCAVEGPAEIPAMAPADAVRRGRSGVAVRRLPPCGDRGGFFMAVLRPELPTEGRPQPRDYLFVLDSSHSSGKRGWGLQLAALEAFLTEMDLRSRFNLMICDATCRTGSSFEKPTAAARQAALKLAAGIAPSGSSNLQAAFEEAGQLLKRGGVKDAQVIYLGDGRPSAGELREPELAARIVAALQGARFSAIQIGDDVSELLLPEATRRLGGAVHRLSPGDDVTRLVLDVVSAQYRPTLSEVELSFEGLDVHHVYPARLASLTAGSEAMLVGRYGRGGQGTLLVRGKLEGRPFERRFPVHLAAEKNERQANRFIPRVWAQHHLEGLTVEDYSRNRPEIVRVSKAYTVLSRATAFLVLENERMYREFGVSRTRKQNDFKGGPVAVRDGKDQAGAEGEAKREAQAASSTPAPAAEPAAGGLASAGRAAGSAAPAAAEEAPAKKAPADDDLDALASADKAPSAERTEAAKPKPAPAPRAKMSKRPFSPRADDEIPAPSSMGGAGVRMRRAMVPVLTVAIQPATPAPSANALRQEESLRRQLAASPLRRALHASYHRVLMRNGSLDEALRHANEWSELDGSNAAALAALADVQALQSDAAVSLRTRTSAVDVEPGNPRWHRQLADMYRNKGQLKQSCAHLWSLVSLAPTQADRYVAAARCLAELPEGREAALQLVADLPANVGRSQGGTLLALIRELRAGGAPRPIPARVNGPMVVQATWDSGADLDVVLVTPGGERISALSSGRAGRTEIDSRDGRTAEVLRLGYAPDGEYRIEIVRLADGARAAKGSASASGSVRIHAHGQTRTLPFTLSAAQMPVAQVRVAHSYPRYYR